MKQQKMYFIRKMITNLLNFCYQLCLALLLFRFLKAWKLIVINDDHFVVLVGVDITLHENN